MSRHLLTHALAAALLSSCGGTADRLEPEQAQIVRYDAFREAAMRGDRKRAEALYEELRQSQLPPELARALVYHGALAAYDAGDWATAARRCDLALQQDPATPWARSLHEVWGRSLERLGQVEAAIRAYTTADLPATRARARILEQHPTRSSGSPAADPRPPAAAR